ncbi:MAG: bifunctional adenosylcobinamide kinase/adenosylcobinamide-phosphate guanylyltransferase [Deltaproteobacteria bacterium]|nr:bifunctional adenosylcobinamide kinase/adenosylcobinamide-phosphate guanylyltransferase [Deltaproteobacteria bacterium]
MKKVMLITGGARSGKSRFALELTNGKQHRAFIATATVTDPEMASRILKHREERGDDFATIEAPLDLASALTSISSETEIVVVDCLTVWLGNLMHQHGMSDQRYDEVTAFLDTIANPPCDVVIVSNELGMGIVPENQMARWFRDVAGRLNQEVARCATDLVFMVSGYPLWIKGDAPDC